MVPASTFSLYSGEIVTVNVGFARVDRVLLVGRELPEGGG